MRKTTLALGLALLSGVALAGAIPLIELDGGSPVVLDSLDGFGPGFDPATDAGQIIVRDSAGGLPTAAEIAPCVAVAFVEAFVEGSSSALVSEIGGLSIQADGESSLVMETASCCGGTPGLAGGCFPVMNRFTALDSAHVSVPGELDSGLADDGAQVVIEQDPGVAPVLRYTGTGRSTTELRDGAIGALQLELLATMTATGGIVASDWIEMHQHARLVLDGAGWPGPQSGIDLFDDAVLEILAGPSCAPLAGPVRVHDTAFVLVDGAGFTVDGVPVALGPVTATEGLLEGTLAGGEALCLPFERAAEAVIQLPEPSGPAAWLAALAAVAARRRSRRGPCPARG